MVRPANLEGQRCMAALHGTERPGLCERTAVTRRDSGSALAARRRVLETVDLAQALETEHPAARHREGAETAQQRRRHRAEPGGAGAGAEFAELVGGADEQ